MKDFFKTVFASAMGVFVALLILGMISFFVFAGIMASMVAASEREYKPENNTVLKIDLTGTLSDRTIENPFASLFGSSVENKLSLMDIKEAVKKAKENDNIKGIYLEAGMLSSGIANLQSLREALADFKESGKFIVAYGSNVSQGAYYLTSMADKMIVNPSGIVDLHGLATIPMFYTGLFEKLGVQMEVFKVGTFKSYVEPYTLTKMSEPNREQVTSYMASLWKHIANDIAASRKMTVEDLDSLVNQGIILKGSEQWVASGLVDTLMYKTDAEDYLKSLAGTDKDEDLKTASIAQAKTMKSKSFKQYDDQIAILFAEGEITDATEGVLNTVSVISEKEYVEALTDLRKDEDIKAVVLRVNSPGGSAYISEQIWKEVVELKKVKPVIVSMGNFAASGGYYISCAADWIVAEPTTITGSIGIFGMFPTFGGLMNKVGLTSDCVKTHTYGDMFDVSRPMRPDEKALMQAFIERGYDLFTSRCAEGRKKTQAEIDSIGQGRVWTGEQALQNGLVDELGGLDRAIEIAAEKAKIEHYNIQHYPAQKDFLTLLMEESMGNAKSRLVKSLMNDAEFRHYTLLKNLDKQDYMQARMPFNLEVQ